MRVSGLLLRILLALLLLVLVLVLGDDSDTFLTMKGAAERYSGCDADGKSHSCVIPTTCCSRPSEMQMSVVDGRSDAMRRDAPGDGDGAVNFFALALDIVMMLYRLCLYPGRNLPNVDLLSSL